MNPGQRGSHNKSQPLPNAAEFCCFDFECGELANDIHAGCRAVLPAKSVLIVGDHKGHDGKALMPGYEETPPPPARGAALAHGIELVWSYSGPLGRSSTLVSPAPG